MTALIHLFHLALLQEGDGDPGPQGIVSWLSYLFPSWGLVLQAIAIIHLIKRGGSYYWIWIILATGYLGAIIYIVVEVIPDASLLRDSFARYGRRSMIRRVEQALLNNPSVGNYEELAELHADQKNFQKARDAYNQAIAARSDSLHSFYGRAICALELGDAEAAVADLEHVVGADGKFANYRAATMLAHAYAVAGRPEDAAGMYDQIMPYSPTMETMLNYALFLRSRGQMAHAREWVEKMMQEKRAMPRYVQRRERPLFRKAAALLKELNA